MPGRNLAVLGTRTDEACDVLAAAALSLAAQGPAHFSIVCLDPDAAGPAARHGLSLTGHCLSRPNCRRPAR